MSVFAKSRLEEAAEKIIPVLEEYYPQQLSDPEFLKMLYDQFDDKRLANFVIQIIQAYCTKFLNGTITVQF